MVSRNYAGAVRERRVAGMSIEYSLNGVVLTSKPRHVGHAGERELLLAFFEVREPFIALKGRCGTIGSRRAHCVNIALVTTLLTVRQ